MQPVVTSLRIQNKLITAESEISLSMSGFMSRPMIKKFKKCDITHVFTPSPCHTFWTAPICWIVLDQFQSTVFNVCKQIARRQLATSHCNFEYTAQELGGKLLVNYVSISKQKLKTWQK